MNVKKMAFMALLLAIALTIFAAESQLPPLAPIPGIKLGLANVVTLAAIYMLGRKEAFTILILRIILGAVFAGNGAAFIYSISGGLLCSICMGTASVFLKADRMWVVSVFGAVGHNIGQIAAACVLTGIVQVVYYLPVLIISGIIMGVFTGLAAQFTYKHMKKAKILKDMNK